MTNKLLQFARPAGQVQAISGRRAPVAVPQVIGVTRVPAPARQAELFGTSETSTLTIDGLNEQLAEFGIPAQRPTQAEWSGQSAEEMTPEQRAAEAQRNMALINAASQVVNVAGSAIVAAINAGSAERLAQITADARVAAAREARLAIEAQSAGRIAEANAAAARAAQATALAQYTAQLQGQRPAGPSTTTMLLIGGAVILGVGALMYFGRGGRTRRNPSERYDNPVMVRQRRGKRRERKFFPADEAPRARRRGWRKAR